jgi:predicted porin
MKTAAVITVTAAKPADGPASGARLRIRAVEAANDGAAVADYDRAYIYVNGRLGTLKLGVNNSYNDEFNLAGRNEMSDTAGRRSLQAGLSLDYPGLILGGGYVNRFDSCLSKGSANRSALQGRNVGLQYAAGPPVVGPRYTDGVREGLQSVAGDDRQRTWSVGAGYPLAPGLRVGAGYLNVRFDDEAGANDRADIPALRATLFF